jgi:hypothetical protein
LKRNGERREKKCSGALNRSVDDKYGIVKENLVFLIILAPLQLPA